MKKYLCLIAFFFVAYAYAINTNKPWTYWWWMGNSVTKDGITQNLEILAKQGFGGVHVIPIYGQKGDEDNFLPYLSKEWMDMLVHTVSEGKRLGMEVDMSCGTGWPMGGPEVGLSDMAQKMVLYKFDVDALLSDKVSKLEGTPVVFSFYDNIDQFCFKTKKIEKIVIDKLKDEGISYVVALYCVPTRQKVKRAAPGGEGFVIDYFNASEVSRYMRKYIDAFKEIPKVERPRAFYHDSYEVYGSNFTFDFLVEFSLRKGYDLSLYLNILCSNEKLEIKQRLIQDYNEVIAELLYERFAETWSDNCHVLNMKTRNQAHGSPGNILDLYGIADIPETESFGSSAFEIPGLRIDSLYKVESYGRPNSLMMKFASSAANIKGRKLVASETGTWLGDHFKVALSQVKPEVDKLFVSGINHIFYHGICYQPLNNEFPGRLFYASTNFGPYSHFWDELKEFNKYVENCQNILQNTEPDNDFLVYFPIHEIWRNSRKKDIVHLFAVHNLNWLYTSSFGNIINRIKNAGYSFDYISDKMLKEDILQVDSLIHTMGSSYKALIIPDCKQIPSSTLYSILCYAKKGARIFFENDIPTDVPGLENIEKEKRELQMLKSQLLCMDNVYIVSSKKLTTLLSEFATPEQLLLDGIDIIRKKDRKGFPVYFLSNFTEKILEDTITLGKFSQHMKVYNPSTNHYNTFPCFNGLLYIRMEPGETLFVQGIDADFDNFGGGLFVKRTAFDDIDLSREWKISYNLCDSMYRRVKYVDSLVCWTKLSKELMYFSGKVRYEKQIRIPIDSIVCDGYELVFENLFESARVWVNNQYIGCVWHFPTKLFIPNKILSKTNRISIEVANLSYNRIVDLMRSNPNLFNYYDINFVNIQYKKYKAVHSVLLPSGIIGKVLLRPVSVVD